MQELINKINPKAKIITFDKNANEDLINVPKCWLELLNITDKNMRINYLLRRWKEVVGNELRNVINYLESHLIDINIICSEDHYSIIYYIAAPNGSTLLYTGKNPLDNRFEDIISRWNEVPISLRRFYEEIQNGFYDYSSDAMGLVELQSVINLDDYEWGILDDLGENLEIELKSSYGFFANGMGTYVVLDLDNCQNSVATLWSSKKPPKYNLNFWDVVDEWIKIGFEI